MAGVEGRLACLTLALGGCGTRTVAHVPVPGGPNPDVVVVGEDRSLVRN